MVRKLLARISEFLGDVKSELRKVAFPSRAETVGSTLVVLVLVVIVGIYLSLTDMALVRALRAIIQ